MLAMDKDVHKIIFSCLTHLEPMRSTLAPFLMPTCKQVDKQAHRQGGTGDILANLARQAQPDERCLVTAGAHTYEPHLHSKHSSAVWMNCRLTGMSQNAQSMLLCRLSCSSDAVPCIAMHCHALPCIAVQCCTAMPC